MNKKIGQNITRIRLEKKMSKQDLSEKAGINRRTITRIEKNISIPRDYTKARLANALECTVEDLESEVR